MKEKVEKHLENSLELINEIGDFCLERKENDNCKALYYVSSNFESAATLFGLLLETHNTLEINTQDKSFEINPYKQVGNLIVDQSRFTFVVTMSSLEYTAKEISIKNELPVCEYLKKDPKTKNKKRYYLGDIIYASEKLKLITANEKKEWDFFIEIRNTLVHNNAIIDKSRKEKGNLEFIVYGKLYSYKEGKMIKGNIQSLFIFSKKAVELFYNWSQKYEEFLRAGTGL